MKIKLAEGAKPKDWYNAECLVCKKRFHLKPYSFKRAKNHYCSQECHRIGKQEYMKGEKNHQYGIKGKNNASWKSDVKLNRNGYIMVRDFTHPFCDTHGWVLEHRLVAEQYLLTDENSVEINGKKYLNRSYQVHHINFDRTDNRKENLVVLTHQQHRKIHNKLNPNNRNEKGQFMKEEIKTIKIKKVTETAIIPERKTIGAAGYDLYVDSPETIFIPPHSTVMVYSGIAFEIPKNYFGAIYARSGISIKDGIRPATCVSVIDSDFRGNVGLPLHNDTNFMREIQPYSRVAQIVFQEAITPELELVDELDETERGCNGFGSSGK